jgi:hypothetical protein
MHLKAVTKQEYADVLVGAADLGRRAWRGELERWSAGEGFSVLWGYNPPAEPLRLAAVLAFLRSIGRAGKDASREALEIVRAFAKLRDSLQREHAGKRAETRDAGLPLFVNFFLVPVYAGMLDHLRGTGDLAPDDMDFLASELPPTVDLLFAHPEWGGHNRTVIRADGLDAAAAALPGATDAAVWRRMSETLAADNDNRWEIEDASIYHSVWMYYLLRWLERRGRVRGLPSPTLRWYAEYFLQLTAPHGTIADFGDGEWRGTWIPYTACFELAARETGDQRYRWAAARTFRACRHLLEPVTGSMPPIPWELADAYRWCADWDDVRCPDDRSRDLDDALAKKVVFRSGWEPADTYLLLDYMDEGSWGWLDRRYLRDTITVPEEKMHHGHSDENSVAMLMSGGSLLLHDAGYRDDLPSGKWGAFRADYFHNRLVVRPARLDRGQAVIELLRNSGAYRRVLTHRVDFQVLRYVDVSRTRLVNADAGWQWDRVVIYVRDRDRFLVVDGFCALRDDFYTAACLWHTQTICAQGDGWFIGGYDRLPGRPNASREEVLPADRRLLVRFAAGPQGRLRGSFSLARHYGPEIAFHETETRHFLAGRWTCWVTELAPLPAGKAANGPSSPAPELVPTDWGDAAVCIRLGGGRGPDTEDLFLIKLDLERERESGDIRPRTPPEAGTVSAGPLSTDAHFVHLRGCAPSVQWSATVVSRLNYDGRTLFEARPNTFGLQPDGAPDRESRVRWRAWEG